MVISINGFNVLPNINAYILVIFFLCAFLPVQKLPLWIIMISLHGIFFMELTSYKEVIKPIIVFQVNSTVAVIVSLAFHHIFYSYRKKEFENISKIREQEVVLKALFEMNPFPLLISKVKDGKVIMVNKELEEAYGIPDEKLENTTDEFLYINNQERLRIINILSNSGKIKNLIMEGKTKKNKKKWTLLNAKLINVGGEECVLSGSLDVTKLKEIESELKTKAYIDPLTKILNREKGREQLDRLYKNIQKFKSTMTICFIDVDNLKSVNDTYGHKEGDILITRIAKAIDENLEQGDVFYRYAGDEFILGFCNKNKMESEVLLKNIQDQLVKEYQNDFSFGLSEYLGNNLSLDELIKIADEDMYIRKKIKKSSKKSLQ
ncbi:MAG: sensor domain-containing diguanylate cyclase [Leptospiraceae bacterium]|nr:sensor domain-containing diguanylate cyclase [Leptospiraceae bacterium]MCP5495566.1 sensor domain-containing diguanylate cyclase [Leptospiraceae bacterium]